jgi:hypothetical protein
MGFGVVATTAIVCLSLLSFGASCRLSAGLWTEWRKLDVIDETLRQLSARPSDRPADAGNANGDKAQPRLPAAADFMFAFPHRQAVRLGPGPR